MRIASFFALILLSATLCSAQADKEKMMVVAKNFYYERIQAIKNIDYRQVKPILAYDEMLNENLVFSVFEFEAGGYVVVSASETVVPVLAYAFEGSLQPDSLAPGCAMWLQSFAKQIDYAINSGAVASQTISEEWQRLSQHESPTHKTIKSGVLPLLNTKWNQGLYYNAMCPADPAGPGGRAVTGCVATALGQLINYFRYPEQGMGSYGYQHDVYGWIEEDFSQQTYNYDAMPTELTDFSDDVARLIYNIGVSVDMNYGPNGSGMWNHKGAYTLRTYFGYNQTTTYLFRDSLPVDFDWKGTLVEHLDQHIPLYYAGWSDYEFIMGHAFILDGYQTDEYYHINWGWGGSSDGYFYIDDLTPGASDFTLLHEVIVNAVPEGNYPAGCQSQKILSEYSGTIDDGSGPLHQYPNSSDCEWLIQPSDSANGIIINFLRFQLDESDELVIFDGHNTEAPVLGVFQGNDLPAQIQSTSDKVLLKFTSDEENQGEGFQLSYRGIKPTYCTLVNNITQPDGVISDGSNQFMYQNNTFCNWYIQPANAQGFTINFTEMDLEPVNDYVKILNASNQTVGNFSGSTLPDQLEVSGHKITITFRSNANTRAGGFGLQYSTTFIEVPQQTQNHISVYPNPCTDIIHIEHNDAMQFNSVEIYSLTGCKIDVQQLLIHDNAGIQINTNSLESGIYMLQLQTESEIIVKRIVKM